MALRNIVQEPNETLRKKCRKVEQITDRILQLLDDMKETLAKADGVGLAAPQVGVLRRVVVIDIGEGPMELINPEILESSGEQTGEEGCLSVAGRWGVVTRPNYVKVKAMDRQGKECIYEGEGLLARAFCHEIDHLDGRLFIDIMKEDIMEDADEE